MKNAVLYIIIICAVSCNGTKQSTARKEDLKNQAVLSEILQQKQAAGIDLYAKGSSPSSWTLDIDLDRIINFRSLDGTDYKSTPVQPVEDVANRAWVFTSKANKGDIVITLYNVACTDVLSGEKFSKKVTVKVDGKLYEGCGQYLSDQKLSGKWLLEKIDADVVSAAAFAKGLPELLFDIDAGKLTGHDGCNRINGSMEVQGNRIRFAAIAGTKMACPGNKKENEFMQKLSGSIASYYFKDGSLVLYLIDDSTLTFKKAK